MVVKVIKNGWEIISSGYIVVKEGETVDFNVEGLLFKLSFETVEGVNPRVGMEIQNDADGRKYMLIKCENFDSSLFRTVNNPLVLANKDDRNIALQFSISSINQNGVGNNEHRNESKLLFYSWSMEQEKKRKLGD